MSNVRQITSNYESDSIFTMEEMVICFDNLGRKNFEIIDEKTNDFDESISEKSMLTLVLTTLADGTLLPSLLICPRTSSFLRIRKHFNISLNLKEDHQLEMDNQSMKKYIWDILKPHNSGEKLLILRETHAIYKQALELLNEINCKHVTIPRGFNSCLQPMDAWTYETPSLKKTISNYLTTEWNEWHEQHQCSNQENKLSEQVLIDLISRALVKLSHEHDLIKNVIYLA